MIKLADKGIHIKGKSIGPNYEIKFRNSLYLQQKQKEKQEIKKINNGLQIHISKFVLYHMLQIMDDTDQIYAVGFF